MPSSQQVPGRVLAIDFGKKRVGLALSDPLRIMASPQGFLPRRLAQDPEARQLIAELSALIEREEVQEIVIGEPTRTDGRPHDWLDEVHTFGALLAELTELPVHYFDERYTTRLALSTFRPGMDPKQKKAEIDGRAAAILLNDYLRHCAIIEKRVSETDQRESEACDNA